LWVGTPNHLFLFSFKDDFVSEISVDDGLLSDEITDIAYDEKHIYVGTRWGINLFIRGSRYLLKKKARHRNRWVV